MNETPKNKCQYCGKEMNRGLTMHEKNCKLNPENKPKPSEDKDHAKDPEQEQAPLIISDVQQVSLSGDEDLPWFEDAQGNRKPEIYNFIGIHENIPCILVMTIYGRLVPPYLVPGFIGMFPRDHEFPKVEQRPQHQEGVQRIAPEEDKPRSPLIEPIISPLDEEKFEQVISQEPIHAQTEKKQSLLSRILGKKEKATTETTNSSADLAKRIIDAQGGAT